MIPSLLASASVSIIYMFDTQKVLEIRNVGLLVCDLNLLKSTLHVKFQIILSNGGCFTASPVRESRLGRRFCKISLFHFRLDSEAALAC